MNTSDPMAELRAQQGRALELGDSLARLVFLATVEGDQPGLRALALRRIDHGLCILIHARSPKWQALQTGGHELLIFWSSLSMQLRLRGRIERLNDEEARELWKQKKRAAQILDHTYEVRAQSAVMAGQDEVIELFEATRRRLADYDEIPPAPGSLGLRLVPDEIDEWRGAVEAPHRRRRLCRGSEGWLQDCLNP